MTPHHGRILLLGILLLLFIWPLGVQAKGLNLAEIPFRFTIGDSKDYAGPTYDDSGWAEYPILLSGGWAQRGAGLDDRNFWQRVTFDGSALADISSPALHIGVLQAGNIFYLNGVEFARVAMLDPPYAGLVSDNNMPLPRTFAFPPNLLNLQGENVLAIRSTRNGLENTFLSGPIEIIEEVDALKKSNARTAFFILYNSLSVFVLVLAFFITFGVWLVARKDTGLHWLLIAFVVLLPVCLLNSSAAAYLEWKFPPALFPFFVLNLSSYVLVPVIEFSAIHLRVRIRWYTRMLQVAILALPFIPDGTADFLFPISRADTLIWSMLSALTFLQISIWAIRGALHRDSRAYPVIVGAAVIWISTTMSLLGLEDWALRTTGSGFGAVTVPLFLLSLTWAGIQPLFEAKARLAEAQSEVLRAQEHERRRVAYDIHDGVGQWLSTIKLNLQMLQGQHRGTSAESGFSEVVGHVDAAISDTRRIAHDLSPAMIEKKGLAAAIRSHADIIRHRSRLTVSVDVDDSIIFAPTVQGHLYRIFQEALQNAVRHGKATAIDIRLAQEKKKYCLEIKDNGIGFDSAVQSDGLGLKSMRQRTELVGAHLDVISSPASGTTLRVTSRN